MELLDSMLTDARRLYEQVTGRPYTRTPGSEGAMHVAKGADPIAHLYQQLAHIKNVLAARIPGIGAAAGASWMPALDAYEAGGQVVLRIELPGVEKSAVNLTVGDSIVVVKGQRSFKSREEGVVSVLAQERFFGPFERWIPLPFRVNPKESEASYRDGVLEIRLVKGESARAVGESVEIQNS